MGDERFETVQGRVRHGYQIMWPPLTIVLRPFSESRGGSSNSPQRRLKLECENLCELGN